MRFRQSCVHQSKWDKRSYGSDRRQGAETRELYKNLCGHGQWSKWIFFDQAAEGILMSLW